MGHPLIMGRKTHESIGKPLDGRTNIVLSRDPQYRSRGCVVAGSLEQALKLTNDAEEVFVIGGTAVYAAALPLADRLFRTEVAGSFDADTFFPSLSDYPDLQWEAHEHVPGHAPKPPDRYGYRVVIEDRVRLTELATAREMVDTTYAKSGRYLEVLEEILAHGVCPFCPEHFDWHPNPILKEDNGWLITRSMQPYEHTAEHFMLIRQAHAERLEELTDEDWVTVGRLCRWAVSEFDLSGGGLTFRWGDPVYTGATVRHLHAHLIIPELNPETGHAKVVSFPIG
jgi:dihydrofolate reductase